MAMADQGPRAEVERPPRLLEAQAEVDVAARADALDEAAELLERLAADHEIAGRGDRAAPPVQAVCLTEHLAVAGVARRDRVLTGIAHDLPGDRAGSRGRRRVEVQLQKARLGRAVCVDEENPLASRRLGAGVACVVGAALAGPAGVVGDYQLVARSEVEAA